MEYKLYILTVIGFVFLMGVIPIGAEEDLPEYEIEYVYTGGVGKGVLGGDTERQLFAVNFYLDDTKIQGFRSSSSSCVTGTENIGSCAILQIIQNEVLINQNNIMIDQNQQIIELLTPRVVQQLTVPEVEKRGDYDWLK